MTNGETGAGTEDQMWRWGNHGLTRRYCPLVASWHSRREQGRQVFDPICEIPGRNTLRVPRTLENAKDPVGSELDDHTRHTGEALHEELHGLLPVQVERAADAIGCVLPRLENKL